VSGGATCSPGGTSTGVAYAAVIASDQPGICGYLQANQNRANARSVDLVMVRLDPASPTTTLTTGTYAVVTTPGSQGSYALLQVDQNDAGCVQSHVIATAGSVQVTSVAGGEIQGTIVALLSDGGKITGAFDAPSCGVTFAGDVCAGSFSLVNPTCAP
jgi:hypothetical protein